jgi:hypothetical protein
LPHSTYVSVIVTKRGDLDLRDGNGYEVFALLADELSAAHVLLEVLSDCTPNDLLEPRTITIDVEYHGT